MEPSAKQKKTLEQTHKKPDHALIHFFHPHPCFKTSLMCCKSHDPGGPAGPNHAPCVVIQTMCRNCTLDLIQQTIDPICTFRKQNNNILLSVADEHLTPQPE